MTPDTSFKTRLRILALVAAAACVAVGGVAYQLGRQQAAHGPSAPATNANADSKLDPAIGRRVLYWHDPMVPGQKFDRPGKSPFMDMELVPVYADAATDAGQVAVSPRQTQNLGLRTVEVRRSTLTPPLEANGTVAWDERGLAVVQARTNGFVEALHVRATLDRVAKGQALAELYVPDWVAAQEEFLAVRRMQGADTAALADAARQRMRQVGMNDEQINKVEREGRVQARITLRAPRAGSVVELGIREGMTVMPGATLFRINALDTVWVNAELPETQVALVRKGMPVEARLAGVSGQVYAGKVEAVLPEVDPATRTVRARVVLRNADGALTPGMFVRVTLATSARPALLVPAEAVIRTGTRSVVMLAEGEGKYRPVDVQVGQEVDGQVDIRQGLQAGQRVVVSGQFLLDSEANLRASATRLDEPAAALPTHEVDAVFESVVDDLAMLSHPPIPALKWGAMTMGFKLPASGWPKDLPAGSHVHIRFSVPASGEPQLIDVRAAGGKP